MAQDSPMEVVDDPTFGCHTNLARIKIFEIIEVTIKDFKGINVPINPTSEVDTETIVSIVLQDRAQVAFPPIIVLLLLLVAIFLQIVRTIKTTIIWLNSNKMIRFCLMLEHNKLR